MLVSSFTNTCYSWYFIVVTYVNILPYKFDPKTFQLLPQTKKSSIKWSRFHKNCMILGSSYVNVRVFAGVQGLESITFTHVCNTIVAISALLLASICLRELHRNTREVRKFANCVLVALKHNPAPDEKRPGKSSISFLIGSFLEMF